jgi:hypothetical protein
VPVEEPSTASNSDVDTHNWDVGFTPMTGHRQPRRHFRKVPNCDIGKPQEGDRLLPNKKPPEGGSQIQT